MAHHRLSGSRHVFWGGVGCSSGFAEARFGVGGSRFLNGGGCRSPHIGLSKRRLSEALSDAAFGHGMIHDRVLGVLRLRIRHGIDARLPHAGNGILCHRLGAKEATGGLVIVLDRGSWYISEI